MTASSPPRSVIGCSRSVGRWERLTRDLLEAGRHMKVAVHDHVIVGANGCTSMRAMGLI